MAHAELAFTLGYSLVHKAIPYAYCRAVAGVGDVDIAAITAAAS
jgi:hypothetical protein